MAITAGMLDFMSNLFPPFNRGSQIRHERWQRTYRIRRVPFEVSEPGLCPQSEDNFAKTSSLRSCGLQISGAESRGRNRQRGHSEDQHRGGHYVGGMATAPSSHCPGHCPECTCSGLPLPDDLRLPRRKHRRAASSPDGETQRIMHSVSWARSTADVCSLDVKIYRGINQIHRV